MRLFGGSAKDKEQMRNEIRAVTTAQAVTSQSTSRLMGKLADNERAFGDVYKKLESMANMQKQIFLFLGDIETRLEAMKTACIRGGIMTEASYEDIWNEIKGYRAKGEGEVIVNGDIVRADVACYHEGKKLFEDLDSSFRIGSGSIVIEGNLVGRSLGEHRFNYTYQKDYSVKGYAGKTVNFHVVIKTIKVKKGVSDATN